MERKGRKQGWASSTSFRTKTDRSGRFVFENIPTGDYRLGYEIIGEPALESAAPPIWYPAAAAPKQAQILHLDATTKLGGLKFQLLPPAKSRRIEVTVIDKNGRAPDRDRLSVWANGEPVKPLSRTAPGALIFQGFEGRPYRISARDCRDCNDRRIPWEKKKLADAEPVNIPAGTGAVKVKLILGDLVPAVAEQ